MKMSETNTEANAEEVRTDHDLREACLAYLHASDTMAKAMKDGVNVHGALSNVTGALNNLQYEVIQVNGPMTC